MLISFFPTIDYRFEKINFFRLSNLGVAGHGLLRNVPHAMWYRVILLHNRYFTPPTAAVRRIAV